MTHFEARAISAAEETHHTLAATQQWLTWHELQQQNIGLRLTKFAVKMRALRLLHDAGVIESRTRYSRATPIEYRAKEIR